MRTTVLAERESAFEATVQEGVPYRWTALDSSLHLIGSLQLSHITYLPPTSIEELRRYDLSAGTASSSAPAVYSVRAVVRCLTCNNKVEDFVLACFPLDVQRVLHADLLTVPPLTTGSSESSAAEETIHSDSMADAVSGGPSPPPSLPSRLGAPVSSLLPRRLDASDRLGDRLVLPCPTDIATRLNVQVGLDGFSELRVEGPGTVVFSGEERIGMLRPSRREYEV